MSKPWKVKNFDPDASLRECLKKILRTKFDEVCSYIPSTLQGDDIEALHDLRVATRRLESVLKLFRKLFSQKLFKHENRTIEQFLKIMGKVRTQDILMQTIAHYISRQPETEHLQLELLLKQQAMEYELHRATLVSSLAKLSSNAYRMRFEQLVRSL